MAKIKVIREPIGTAPKQILQLAMVATDDLQEFVDELEWQIEVDPDRAVSDSWEEMTTNPHYDSEGGYMTKAIVKQINEYFTFTGEWVTE